MQSLKCFSEEVINANKAYSLQEINFPQLFPYDGISKKRYQSSLHLQYQI